MPNPPTVTGKVVAAAPFSWGGTRLIVEVDDSLDNLDLPADVTVTFHTEPFARIDADAAKAEASDGFRS